MTRKTEDGPAGRVAVHAARRSSRSGTPHSAQPSSCVPASPTPTTTKPTTVHAPHH